MLWSNCNDICYVCYFYRMSSKSTSTPGTSREPSPKKAKKHSRTEHQQLIHLYILKFEARESKLNVMLNKLYELADTDMLLCNRDTGLNDYSLNRKLADKLESVAKSLVGLSKRCTEKANDIREKISQAEDKKINMQDIVCTGEVLKPSDKCNFLKARHSSPKHWVTDEGKLIKREVCETISSDESGDEMEEFPGDMDTKFTYTKENNNTSDRYPCPDCDNLCRDSQELRNHQSHHHTELFRCMRCFTVCRSERSFYNHKQTHDRELNVCPVADCGMHFPLKTSLTNHLQKHSSDRLKCDKCPRTFQYRQSHIEHIKYRHRSTRTVPCPVCHKYFWTPTSMRSHRAKYHGLVSELYDGKV